MAAYGNTPFERRPVHIFATIDDATAWRANALIAE
jgi:hypothetical protein